MAKILTGPLAAGLSGKLGPVVFHQTRFGQVVQSKAKGRKYTTPAALTAKARFKEAATAAGSFGSSVGYAIGEAGSRENSNLQGLFIGRYLKWRNGEAWSPYRFANDGAVNISGHTSTGLQRRLAGSLAMTTAPNAAIVWWLTLLDGKLLFSGSSLWIPGSATSGLSSRDVPEPFVAIVLAIHPIGVQRPDPVEALALLDAYAYAMP